MKFLTSWILFLLGDLWCRIFDDWTRIGLRGPIYKVYNCLMLRSVLIQGDGNGPWQRMAANSHDDLGQCKRMKL